MNLSDKLLWPQDCQAWDYTNYPDYKNIVGRRSKSVLLSIKSGRTDASISAADTRPTHAVLFDGLVSAGFEYYVGNYRGSDFRCLQNYPVGVAGDPRIGSTQYPGAIVESTMSQLAEAIIAAIAALDAAHGVPDSQLARKQKIAITVEYACTFLVHFFTVHPYANGNGHVGRFIINAMLGRYGYLLKNFPIDPRPSHNSYGQMLRDYRDGVKEPLEKFIISNVIRQ